MKKPIVLEQKCLRMGLEGLPSFFYLLLLLVAILSSRGQEIGVRSFVQQTVMGTQEGYAVSIDFGRIGVGAVMQSNSELLGESEDRKYPFVGVEVRFPLNVSDKLTLYASPKFGMVDQQFFVMIPEVQTEMRLNRIVTLVLGTGIRARQAAVSAGIKINPLNFRS